MLGALFTALLLAAPVCQPKRDANGHIARDPQQRARFRASHPCPGTGKVDGACKGYTVDHVCPLKCCGADDPSNMQWQTHDEAKAKDAWEGDCSSCPAQGSGGARESKTHPTKKPPAASPVPTECCVQCKTGCACGDSCISCDRECHKPPGCAC